MEQFQFVFYRFLSLYISWIVKCIFYGIAFLIIFVYFSYFAFAEGEPVLNQTCQVTHIPEYDHYRQSDRLYKTSIRRIKNAMDIVKELRGL